MQITYTTVCPESSDPFYKITYYIKWVVTSWTYGTYTYYKYLFYLRCIFCLGQVYLVEGDDFIVLSEDPAEESEPPPPPSKFRKVKAISMSYHSVNDALFLP